jgi:hypothetical protein
MAPHRVAQAVDAECVQVVLAQGGSTGGAVAAASDAAWPLGGSPRGVLRAKRRPTFSRRAGATPQISTGHFGPKVQEKSGLIVVFTTPGQMARGGFCKEDEPHHRFHNPFSFGGLRSPLRAPHLHQSRPQTDMASGMKIAAMQAMKMRIPNAFSVLILMISVMVKLRAVSLVC